MSSTHIAVAFEYNEIALKQLRHFAKRKTRWLARSKEWVVAEEIWAAFLETLYDAPLAWREFGYTAPEICNAMTVLRAAKIRAHDDESAAA